VDERTPVIVGVGQVEQRVEDPREGKEPLALMLDALEQAAKDAGSRSLLRAADSVCVIRGAWRYENPAAVVADRLGVPGAETIGTPFGGNMAQSAVSHAALAIQRGERDATPNRRAS
jgi:acetyl-CoA C-acetyltransferase